MEVFQTFGFIHSLSLGFVLMLLLMSLLWLYHLKVREADIVDAGWAFGLGTLAILYAVVAGGDPTRRVVLALLVYCWAFRLGGYIFFFRVLKEGEDPRYQKLREKWGDQAPWKFLVFFLAQGGLNVFLSLAFLLIARSNEPFGATTDIIALLVWFTGLYGEIVADMQLAAWRKNPDHKGKTCRGGLWAYSRHPNYFFEIVHWCSYPLFAAAGGFGPFILGALAPFTIAYLILKVTGIPPTEAAALESRYDYRDYQRTVSALVPWIPKKIKES